MRHSIPLLALLCACQSGARSPEEAGPSRAAATGVGSAEAGEPNAAAEPVMRTYQVPHGRMDYVESVLRSLLKPGENSPGHGRVKSAGDGRIVVVATPHIQAGVAQLIEDVGKAPAQPGHTVRISYWFVAAAPDKQSNGAQFPAIAPALDEIVAHEGPMTFELVENTSPFLGAYFGPRGLPPAEKWWQEAAQLHE